MCIKTKFDNSLNYLLLFLNFLKKVKRQKLFKNLGKKLKRFNYCKKTDTLNYFKTFQKTFLQKNNYTLFDKQT